MEKFRVFEDNSTVSCCATRKTGDPAINVCRRSNFDVPNRQSERGKNLPYGHPLPDRLHALACTYSANLLVLKASEHIRKERRWPDRIIIREYDDICRGVFNPVAHLQSLIREWDGEDAYPF